MYAVIFRAEVNQLDSRYSEMASKMRTVAISEYGCIESDSYDYLAAISAQNK